MAARPFDLSRDPFAPTLDPAEAFASQAFEAARDAALRELRHGARLVALIGAAGTGKTLLLQAIAAQLAAEGQRIRRLDRGDLVNEAALADIEILLVDEADAIDDAGLLALARRAADPSSPAVVLALTRRRLDHLDLPITARTVTLDEMNSSDARDFVLDRLRRAGGDPALFAPGALGAITYAAGGSPRLLRLLGAGALFQAAHEAAPRVEMSHARRAIAVQRGGNVEPPPEDEALPVIAAAPATEAVVPPAQVAISPRATRETLDIPVPTEPQPAAPPPAPIVVPEPELNETTPLPEARKSGLRPRHAIAAAVVALLAGGGALLWQREATPIAAPPPTPPKPATPPLRPLSAPEPVAQPEPETESEAEPAPPVLAAIEPQPESEPAKAPPPEPTPVAEPVPPPPPRIVVRYAGEQPGSAEAAGRIADLLRARGYEVADVRAAPGRIRTASTRYAAGERAAGEAANTVFESVLRAYQPGAISRAAPSAEGAAARGTIELWVPDSAAGASRPLRTDLPPG